jgi:tripartite-type tricarboxylate transporter receptor subunit TctC
MPMPIVAAADMIFDFPAGALPHICAGSTKGCGLPTRRDRPGRPRFPQSTRSALQDLHLTGWHALFVPKGTSQAIVKTHDSAVIDALADPNAAKGSLNLNRSFTRAQPGPEALAAYHTAEIEK